MKETVKAIVDLVNQKLSTLDQQEQQLYQIVNLKLYSFHHYLRKIKFKVFAKWCVIN